MKPYCFTKQAGGLPTIEQDDSDTIQAAFFELAKLLSTPDPDKDRVRTWFRDKVPELIKRDRWGSHRKWICTALFNPAHAAALEKLYKAIQEGMSHAYAEGKDDGSNLLRRLARGDIGPKEFDENTKDD